MSVEASFRILELIRSAQLRSHERGVGRLSAVLAKTLGQEPSYCSTLAVAAELHDVGKLGISDVLLEKPGRLDADEWETMKRHTLYGFTILHEANTDLAAFASSVALNHHECWDGRGYPNKLKGEAIPQAARIVSLCDVYDALREQRSYKAPRSHDEVMSMMFHNSADRMQGKFDPTVVDAALSHHELLAAAYDG